MSVALLNNERELFRGKAKPLPGMRLPVPVSERVNDVLNGFSSHALSDLNQGELMDRVDSKYLIPESLLADFLTHMRPHYSALEIAGQRVFRYKNDYYDSADYKFYRAHHARRLNRYKVRCRTYVDSQTSFLEIKHKNNKRRTEKTRVQVEVEEVLISESSGRFLNEHGVGQHKQLKHVQTGLYDRLALANEAEGERVTIDCNLEFHDIALKQHCSLGPWVVIELKQAQRSRLGPCFQWAREHGIRSTSFSKYCMGIYFTGPSTLKRNNFHMIARRLRDIDRRLRLVEQ